MAESVYKTSKIIDGMWNIEEGKVRAFLIEGETRAMLVDTGFGTGDISAEVKSLTDKPVFVVNTHADRDHIGCNDMFDEVYLHPSEYDRYSRTGSPKKKSPFPVWEGDIIDFGRFSFEVILIPGHTPGSIALLERNRRFLISGDSVQSGDIFMFGEGRNLPAYIESLKKLQKLSGCFDTVYASHSNISVRADIIPELLEGAIKLMRGEISSENLYSPPMGADCKLYRCPVAGFLY